MNIASTVVEEEGTLPDADMTVDMAHLLYAQTAVVGFMAMPPYVPRIPQQCVAERSMVVARPMVARTPQQRMVADRTVAVVVADRMVAANTANR